MLVKKGYAEIIAVRTKAPGVYRRVRPRKGVTVRTISPGHSMGNSLIFDPEKISENIDIGYRDGLAATEAFSALPASSDRTDLPA